VSYQYVDKLLLVPTRQTTPPLNRKRSTAAVTSMLPSINSIRL